MKRLNQNNAIATTAMLTKTNFMKNRMNLFAKVVMLVVMMGMLVPKMAWGQGWTNPDGTWYIINISHTTSEGKGTSDTYSYYLPNEASVLNGRYYRSGGWYAINFYLKIDNNDVEDWSTAYQTGGKEDNHTFTKNLSAKAGIGTLQYRWTYNTAPGNTQPKTMSFTAKVPIHLDCRTTSLDFGQIAINGNTTKAITLKSFLTATSSTGLFITTSNPNVFKIGSSSNTHSQETLCSGGNQAYSPYNSNSNYDGNLLNIYFTPTSFGTFNETIYIYDGTTLLHSIPVTGTCAPTYTWTTNTTLVQNEVVDNAASISGFTGTIYYESSDRSVIDLLDNNNQIVPTGSKGTKIVSNNAGTATITASINESSVTSTCVFNVTNLGVQVIEWNQDRDLLRLKMGTSESPMTLTAVAKDKSSQVATGSVISYSSSDPNVVSVSGNQLMLVGQGEAVLTATAPAIPNRYVAATTTRQVKVKAAGDNSCTEFAISGVIVDENSQKTISFNGIYPDKLSFTAEWGAWATGSSSIYAVDGNGNHIGDALYTVTYTGKSWTDGSETKSNIQVPINAAGLKFEGDIQGGRKYVSVTVTQASFMERLIESYDFGNGAINVNNTHDITAVQYSNLNDEITATITGTNADQFGLNTLGYGGGCSEQGNAVFSVTFKPTSVGPKTATLHLSAQIGNSPVSCDVTLTGNGAKLPQTITWNAQPELADGQLFSLTTKPDNVNQTAPITLNAHTTAKHGDDELDITYTPDNTDIAYVTGNQLYINKAGTVTITATQAGDATYEPAQNAPSYTLHISKVTPNLTITGNTTPEVFSKFQVSASSTGTSEGFSRASDGTVTFSVASNHGGNPTASISDYVEANRTCSVTVNTRGTEEGVPTLIVAHLAETDIYEAKTEPLTVYATKATPIIDWPESSEEFTNVHKVGDSPFALHATVGQGSVKYVSSDESIATVDNNMTCVAAGVVKITAKFDGSVDYKPSTAAEEVSRLIVVSPADFGAVKILSNKTIQFKFSTGESGTFDITSDAAANFFVSTDNTTGWSNTNLPGINDGSTIYFKFQPNCSTDVSKSFTITHSGKNYYVSLSGTGTENKKEWIDNDCHPLVKAMYYENDWLPLPNNFLSSQNATASLTLSENTDEEFLIQYRYNETGAVNLGTGFNDIPNDVDGIRIALYPKNYKTSYNCVAEFSDNSFPGIKYPIIVSAPNVTTYSRDLYGNPYTGQASTEVGIVMPLLGRASNGTLTISNGGNDNFLVRENAEGSVWAKQIEVTASSMGNWDSKVYVYYVPKDVTTQETCTLTVHDNNPISDSNAEDYYLILNATGQGMATYAFTEQTPVMGISSESQHHVLTGFEHSGNLTIDASGTNFIVSRTETGTYGTSLIIGATEANKEFYIKFAPMEGGNIENIINITDAATGIIYPVKCTGTTATNSFADTHIGQASEAMQINLSSFAGATSFTVTSDNPYIFRAFTDNEEGNSTATAAKIATSDNGSISFSGNSFYVKFYPEEKGEATANITITPNVGRGITLPFGGIGIRDTLNFGTKNIGDFTGQMSFGLTNMVSAQGFTVRSENYHVFRLNGHALQETTCGTGETVTVNFFPVMDDISSDNTSYYSNDNNAITIVDNFTGRSYKIYNKATAHNIKQNFGNTLTVGETSTVQKSISFSGLTNESNFDVRTSEPDAFRIDGSTQNKSAVNGQTYNITFVPLHRLPYSNFIYLHDKEANFDYPLLSASGEATTKDNITLSWSVVGGVYAVNPNDKLYDIVQNNKGYRLHPKYKIVSQDEEYVELSTNKDTIYARQGGIATINFDLSTEDTRDFDFNPLSDATINVTMLKAKYISWSKNLNFLKYDNPPIDPNNPRTTPDILLDAKVVDKDGNELSDQPIYYQLKSSPNNCVTITQQQYLQVIGIGTDSLIIWSPANDTMLAARTSKSITVTQYTGKCETITYTQNQPWSTTAKDEKKYIDITRNGTTPPIESVDYNIYIDGGWGFGGSLSTSANVKIYFNGTNTEITNISVNGKMDKDNRQGSFIVPLTDRNASQINVHVTEVYDEIFGRISYPYTISVSDIVIKQASYFEKVTQSVDFGPSEVNADVDKTVSVNYSALSNNIHAEIINDNSGGAFQVEEYLEISDCEAFGTYSFNVKFKPDHVQASCSATLKLTGSTDDGDVELTIPLSGVANIRSQNINWNNNQVYDQNYSDRDKNILLTAYSNINKMLDGNAPVIEYTITPEGQDIVNLITGTDGKSYLQILNAGTVNVTASQEGDQITAPATSQIQITIGEVDHSILWENIDSIHGVADNLQIFTDIDTTSSFLILNASSRDNNNERTNFHITYNFTITSEDGCTTDFAQLFDTTYMDNGNLEVRYLGGGSCYVTIEASLSGVRNYKTATPKYKHLHVDRVTPTPEWNTAELDDLHYGDRVTMTPKTAERVGLNTYTFSSSYIDNDKFVVSPINILEVHDITQGDVQISVTKDMDCWNNDQSTSATKTVSVAPSPQKIVWGNDPQDFYAGIFSPDTVIDLDAYSIDQRHSTVAAGGTGDSTCLAMNEDGEVLTNLGVVYFVKFEPYNGCDSDFVWTIEEGKLRVSRAVAGKVTIKARCIDQSGKYTDAEEVTKQFEISRFSPGITANIHGGSNTITFDPKENAYTIDATISAHGYTISDANSFTYSLTSSGGVIEIDNEKVTTLKSGSATVLVTFGGDCMTNVVSRMLTIEVEKADRNVTIDNEPLDVTTLGYTTLLSTVTPTYGDEVIVPQYSVVNGDNFISIINNNQLFVKQYPTGACTVRVDVEATDQYNACFNTKDVTVKDIPITFDISDTYTLPEEINSATKDLEEVGSVLENAVAFINCNYDDAVYVILDTAAEQTDSIAEVVGNTFTAYRHNDITLRVKATSPRSATYLIKDISFNIPRGTFQFNTAGKWNENDKWHRSDILPNTNHNVQINDTCTIPSDFAAEVYGMTNTLPENLVLDASEDNSATLVFYEGNPDATIRMYFKGHTNEIYGGGYKNPDWQYRGFIGNYTNDSWDNNVLVYKWVETQAAQNQSRWVTATESDYKPWAGLCMANMTDQPAYYQYKTKLLPIVRANDPVDSLHLFRLTYSSTQLDNTQDSMSTSAGVNIVTNSFSAPLRVSQLEFTNMNQQVFFFKNNHYLKWRKEKGTSYVACPSQTCEAVNGNDIIPAGHGFLVQADSRGGSTISIPEGAVVKNQASGAYYAPAEKKKFNILSIRLASDSIDDDLFLLESDECTKKYDNGYDGLKMFADGLPQIYATNKYGKTSINADSSMLGQFIGFYGIPELTDYELEFDIDRLEGFTELYLFDHKTKHYANILGGGTYRFTAVAGYDPERFQIMGRRDDGTYFTGEDQWIEVVGQQALLHGFDNEDEMVYIIDLMGNRVWSSNSKNGPWFTLPDVPSGMYVIYCGKARAKFVVK